MKPLTPVGKEGRVHGEGTLNYTTASQCPLHPKSALQKQQRDCCNCVLLLLFPLRDPHLDRLWQQPLWCFNSEIKKKRTVACKQFARIQSRSVHFFFFIFLQSSECLWEMRRVKFQSNTLNKSKISCHLLKIFNVTQPKKRQDHTGHAAPPHIGSSWQQKVVMGYYTMEEKLEWESSDVPRR